MIFRTERGLQQILNRQRLDAGFYGTLVYMMRDSEYPPPNVSSSCGVCCMQQIIDQDVSVKRLTLSSLKVVLRWLQCLFTPLAFCMFVYVGWQSRATFAVLLTQANLSSITFAMLTLLAVQFVVPLVATLILKSCGESFTYAYVLDMYIKRLPARYVPGGIWHTAGRLADLYAQGVRPWVLTLFTTLENSIPAGIAFVLGGGSILYFHGLKDIWGKSAFALMIAGASILCIIPMFLPMYFAKMKGEKFGLQYYFQSLSIYIGVWTMMSLAFYFYSKSFLLVFDRISFYEIGGAYLFSWSIGFIAIFSPQGIGVFEFVAGNLLDYNVDIMSLSIVILGFRSVTLCIDILVYTFRLINKMLVSKIY